MRDPWHPRGFAAVAVAAAGWLALFAGGAGLGARVAGAEDLAVAQMQIPADSPIGLFWELPLSDLEGVASGVTGAQG